LCKLPQDGISAAPAGARFFVTGFRWLTPPANFRGASGTKKRPVFKSVW
jgi:hypothetical protein